MHKSVIEDFFDHILQRQTAQGPERAFRFKAIKASNGSVSPAHYPTDINNPAPSRRISKCSSQRNANAVPDAMPDAAPAPEEDAAPDARPVAAAEDHAVSAPKPSAQLKRVATGRKKPKQPGRTSTAAAAQPPNSLQLTDTTELNYVQVNQTTMDILCTAGVAQPQPINGPADGVPEYLIPQHMYARYITHVSGGNEDITDTSCPIDPSLLDSTAQTAAARAQTGAATAHTAAAQMGVETAQMGAATAQMGAATAQMGAATAQMGAATAHTAAAQMAAAAAQMGAATAHMAAAQMAAAAAQMGAAIAHMAAAQTAAATAQMAVATAQSATGVAAAAARRGYIPWDDLCGNGELARNEC
jgi:hypothetical protein